MADMEVIKNPVIVCFCSGDRNNEETVISLKRKEVAADFSFSSWIFHLVFLDCSC